MKYKTILLIIYFWIFIGHLLGAIDFNSVFNSMSWSGYAIFLCWVWKK